MDELVPHPDPMVEAGRKWMRGELDSETYFAMARREARRHVWRSERRARAGWWARLRRATTGK